MIIASRRRRAALSTCLAAAALVAAGCGGDDDSAEGGLTEATLRLDWTYLPNHIPFLWAEDQGFYEDEGIDLEIAEGQGSGSSVNLVANGQDEFAYASTEGMMLSLNEGLPVKSILVVQRRNSNAIVCYKDVGFEEPKDLEGRTVLVVPGSSATIMLDAALDLNGVDSTKVQQINGDSSSQMQLFLDHRADCMLGQLGNDTLRAGLQNNEIDEAHGWVDYGVGTFGHSIVANSDRIADDPELYRAFVRATIKAWQEVCSDPDPVAEWYIENYPQQNEDDFWKNYTRMSLPMECEKTLPPEGEPGEPMTPTEEETWAGIIDFLETYSGMDDPKEPSAYFTNEFIDS